MNDFFEEFNGVCKAPSTLITNKKEMKNIIQEKRIANFVASNRVNEIEELSTRIEQLKEKLYGISNALDNVSGQFDLDEHFLNEAFGEGNIKEIEKIAQEMETKYGVINDGKVMSSIDGVAKAFGVGVKGVTDYDDKKAKKALGLV